jgi:hypothetical protein
MSQNDLAAQPLRNSRVGGRANYAKRRVLGLARGML